MTPQIGCGIGALYANGLEWGVVVRCTRWPPCCPRAPRWIGWLGLLAGWLRLLRPASSIISGISSMGFVVFMLSMGIALLRRQPKGRRIHPGISTNTELTSPTDSRLS